MIWQFVALLAVHWLGDFVLQSHWMASNKSKDWWALSLHVLVYTWVLFMGILTILYVGLLTPRPLLPTIWMVIAFTFLNGLVHFVVDAVTSRVTSRLYARGDIHNFFVVVGLDQLLHQLTLAATLVWLLN